MLRFIFLAVWIGMAAAAPQSRFDLGGDEVNPQLTAGIPSIDPTIRDDQVSEGRKPRLTAVDESDMDFMEFKDEAQDALPAAAALIADGPITTLTPLVGDQNGKDNTAYRHGDPPTDDVQDEAYDVSEKLRKILITNMNMFSEGDPSMPNAWDEDEILDTTVTRSALNTDEDGQDKDSRLESLSASTSTEPTNQPKEDGKSEIHGEAFPSNKPVLRARRQTDTSDEIQYYENLGSTGLKEMEERGFPKVNLWSFGYEQLINLLSTIKNKVLWK